MSKKDTHLERLHDLHLQALHTQRLIEASAEYAREEGASWAEIGAALSITKQGAQKRFGKSS